MGIHIIAKCHTGTCTRIHFEKVSLRGQGRLVCFKNLIMDPRENLTMPHCRAMDSPREEVRNKFQETTTHSD